MAINSKLIEKLQTTIENTKNDLLWQNKKTQEFQDEAEKHREEKAKVEKTISNRTLDLNAAEMAAQAAQDTIKKHMGEILRLRVEREAERQNVSLTEARNRMET